MSRTSSRRATRLVLMLLAVLTGCNSGPTGVETRRFPCTEDSECATGFVCRAAECLPEEEPGGRPDSGTPDGGAPDGGTDGGPDSGTPDGGDTLVPTVLAFANSQPPLVAGQCSKAVEVETRTEKGAAAPVTAATIITLSANPNTGIAFYRDSNCQTPTALVTVEAGSSRAAFYVKGTVAREVHLGLVAQGFSNANQAVTFRAGPPASLSFVTSAQTLPAGGCSARVEIEARDTFTNPASFTSARTVGLKTQNGSGITFFTDPECKTPLSELVLPAGEPRAFFYFKGRTGGQVTLATTVSGLAQITQRETILPMVRMGFCSLAANRISETCSFDSAPPQLDTSKTMLFFQASSDENDPSSASVRCALTSKNAITCSRNDDGSEIEILWQTAEKPSGLRVQHLSTACKDASRVTTIPLKPVSNLQNTFLLVSSEQGGTTLGDDDFFTARLTSEAQVELAFSTNCNSGWKASVQVVEAEGATVTRSTTEKMVGNQLVVSGLPPVTLSSSALLFTYRVSNTDAPVLCDRVLRGELTSPTSITFSRGAGSTSCTTASIDAISWERIDFGPLAQAQHTLVTLNPSSEGDDFIINPVDMTRSLIFASGQGMSGQAGGESSYAGDDIPGASLGWFEIYEPSEFAAYRGFAAGTAKWNSTVLQLEP
ncbi:hypothetical protein [Stigmatella aurantiaca]|uniref:Lipoprotein n=1 Tax=Stigmatella aurantiaca (strain DW4/3-1) TaxID=378806 RepID=Q094X7_STIAD|nr:hypothetical protein [Stigmatella aurantiaca]ADO71345.1 uncharacterized protein STAUR_3555 [Stigmatella aurantiaca DW4/3-1]EAU67295.1 hypothetical protein STIAU_4949 [Stigmatella aurantiaca DW4/3-1]